MKDYKRKFKAMILFVFIQIRASCPSLELLD